MVEEASPGRFVLTLHGELDLATEPVFAKAVRQVLAHEQVGEVLVNLAELEFMDSTGVRALLRTRKAAQTRGVSFRVCQPRGPVARVLRGAAVDQLLGLPR